MLTGAKVSREEALRASIRRRLGELEEHAEARALGLSTDPANEVAEELIRIGIATEQRELEDIRAARDRRPMAVGAYFAAAVAVAVGITTGNMLAALAIVGTACIAYAWRARPTPSATGPVAWIDPSVTPSRAWREAGTDARYTHATLGLFYGKDYVDRLYDDVQELGTGEDADAAVQPIHFRDGEQPGLLNQEVH